MVIRNAGGRVSPDVLTDLAYIGYLSAKMVSRGDGPRFEVAVIHHTDYAEVDVKPENLRMAC
jgi:carbonic anhydrase